MHAPAPSTVARSAAASPPGPFLKWAGGKRQLLPALRRFYPAELATYREPFLGSGAVFFDLIGRRPAAPCVLTDINADLIGCYLRVRDSVDEVIETLVRLEAAHRRAPAAHYYRIRDERFNPARAAIARDGVPQADRYPAELAAMLIYLNRTGFNGLFRVNAGGRFNVPLGRYANPTICDADTLRRAAGALARPNVTIAHRSYQRLLDVSEPGDFVYLDPPYAPLSPTARFTAYTAARFSGADQQRLQHIVLELARRGCQVVLSNSVAPEVTALYDDNDDAARAGLAAYTVPARRAINSNGAGRGQVMEYLITNVPERPGPAAPDTSCG